MYCIGTYFVSRLPKPNLFFTLIFLRHVYVYVYYACLYNICTIDELSLKMNKNKYSIDSL